MKTSSHLKNLTPEGLALVAGRFRLLSEPLRLQILNRLQEGETSVSQLAQDIGTSQPNVSKHLRLLIEGGLVARRQERTSVLVRVPVVKKPETEARNRPAAPSLFNSGGSKRTVACEPMVSVLTEVAKQLQPGRCVT